VNHDYQELVRYGWNQYFQSGLEDYALGGLQPGRVTFESGRMLRVQLEDGCVKAEMAGRMKYLAQNAVALPTVGDWVAIELTPDRLAVIHRVLPRFSQLVRKAAGQQSSPQLIAANIDTILIMTTVTQDFNPRRIERYVAAAWQSGAQPAIVVGKIDLCDRGLLDERLSVVEHTAPGVPAYPLSALSGEGLDELGALSRDGLTLAIVGSSGVGKSSLINRLLGSDQLSVGAIRADDEKGRHTTTSRELITIPGGGLIIDTPGMREFQLWDGGGLDTAFADIASLATNCRFRDCCHTTESDCAVLDAIGSGVLSPERFHSFLKLQREVRFQEMRGDKLAQSLQRKRWKRLSRLGKERSAEKRRGF
jgi:ribosome biogenesis GTPase